MRDLSRCGFERGIKFGEVGGCDASWLDHQCGTPQALDIMCIHASLEEDAFQFVERSGCFTTRLDSVKSGNPTGWTKERGS